MFGIRINSSALGEIFQYYETSENILQEIS